MTPRVADPSAWGSRAACKGRYELMFDDDPASVEEAKVTCENCPVCRKCLNFALDGDVPFGVWGGMTFAERTHVCPICHKVKEPSQLGCSGSHSILRLARLVEQERNGDPTVSITNRGRVSAPTSSACLVPRGRSHATPKAYREGCRCEASRLALKAQRDARPPALPKTARTIRERFFDFVEISDEGHWWWNGGLNGSGFGNFWDGRRTVRAHIFAYTEFVGPMPPDSRLQPIAGCPSRRCVNPEHYRVRKVWS